MRAAMQEASQEVQQKEQMASAISDDIFKALLTELKVELDLLLIRDPRKLFRDEDIAFFNESGKFPIFDRKGIKTDLFAIEAYVDEVFDEVMRDQEAFNHSINKPITKNAMDLLN